mgnify:CR=1 FL=1
MDNNTLRHLAKLARIEIPPAREKKLLHDMQGIFRYFGTLKEVPTEHIASCSGGTLQENVFREDREDGVPLGNPAGLVAMFSEQEDGYLRVPKIL